MDDYKNILNDDDFISTESKTDNIIKVIGVGGGGGNAVNHMYKQNIEGVSFVVCNTDKADLDKSPVPTRVQIGKSGLGAGAQPEKARKDAEESVKDIENIFDSNTKMVFITAGMGGGTGTGAAPVIARLAREKGILTIGIVTIPFLFEGDKKIKKGLMGAEEMGKYVDALLIINNQRLIDIYPDLTFLNAFAKADDILTIAASSISEIITKTGKVNLDFEDVQTTLKEGGAAIISNGYGEGPNRVEKAIEDALHSPLLKECDVYSSKRLLFNLYFSSKAENELTAKEISQLNDFTSNISDVDIIWGTAYDDSLGDKVKITILASGFNVSVGDEQKAAEKGTKIWPRREKQEPVSNEELLEQKMADMYGSSTTFNPVVLDPSAYDDDAAIEAFESKPTATRKKSEASEIASTKSTDTDDKPSDEGFSSGILFGAD
ncbi:MAG: cell division protein FtsZ [Muribaculaceae bacterium]|nr:cell division protein FtsZ [Muribaculaceae bacterium]